MQTSLRWGAALALLLCLGSLSSPAVSPLDLTGSVKSIDGHTLTNAHIFIYTAGPRVGVGYI
jgi:hypothetical protein